ncbi:hypothetical protein DKX38_022026 [Salix brachista]|uniref:Uncharacterized protein n=1 Tax=Salix brachista TaxID=2182728 RepID=A0A5N5KAQ4_9ROSI|nr:hypothetical protein DKX38_022026 [Salix brachista]
MGIIHVDELILEMPYEEFIQEDFMGIWEAMTILMGMHLGHRLGNGNERRGAILEFVLVDHLGFVNTFFSDRDSKVTYQKNFDLLCGRQYYKLHEKDCRDDHKNIFEYQSPYWRAIAATRIQVAWRYRQKRLKHGKNSRSNNFAPHSNNSSFMRA